MESLSAGLSVIVWGCTGGILLLLLIAIFFFIYGLKSVIHSECSATTTAFLSLCVSVLTVALIPIDIFLVSSMKDGNGTFEDWAADNVTRNNIQKDMQYSYYALYCCNAVFLFFIIPFVMFYYEEGDEDSTRSERCCTAIKYTTCCVVVAGVLLLVGAFVPWQGIPEAEKNSTKWEEFQYLINEFGNGKGFDALYFLLGSIALLGILGIIGYTGIGMAAIPITMIKGTQSVKSELDETDSAIQHNIRRKNAVRRKYEGRGRMSSRDQRRLQELDDEEQLIKRRERHLKSKQKSLAAKCGKFWRPFQVVAGLLLLMLSFLLIISLFITSLDRALHSLGPRSGYVLRQRNFPNPVDIILLYAQRVYPLDLVLYGATLTYFFWTSVGGIRRIGIWLCCIRIYRIRPKRTKPQALLFMCAMVICMIMALNTMLYTLAPDYLSYGYQKYIPANGTEPVQCNTQAGKDCVMTVTVTLMTKFLYKVWFFGACYYWSTWAFIGVFLISVVVALIRRRESSIEGRVEASDTEDSDEEMLEP
ncbi:probable lysosomal cobalamin transporter [Diadema antillarum]|uniref:probable lysosomal cobalamin transporter n=1 Tax=Diadema antillarum TaxID=105358 RepID=UPI003A8C625C